ncbi:hypothetical protein BZG21_34900, partial [Escherichia coli]|nr:hypothetical protein [Escherichia coli]
HTPRALSSDLPTLTAEINAYKRVAGEAIFEIGKRLKSVRDAKIDAETADERRLAQQREDAGGWIRWLDDNFNFKRTQAHVYVSLAEKQNELGVRTSEHQGADAGKCTICI